MAEAAHGGEVGPQGTRATIGRPKALDPDQIALAQRMRDSGEPVPVIAETLGVSRATLYRTLAEQA